MRQVLFPALALVALLGATAPAAADDPPPSPALPATGTAATSAPSVTGAPTPTGARATTLIVFNRPVIRFRASFLGITPEERNSTARDRIAEVLARGGPGNVTFEPLASGGAVVSIDGALAFVISRDDAPGLADVEFTRFVEESARRLVQAIAETRELRDTHRLMESLLAAGIATAAWAALLFVLLRIGRWVRRRVPEMVGAATANLRVGGTAVLERTRTARLVLLMTRALGWFLVLLVTYEWLGYLLERFPYTRPWGERLNVFLLDIAGAMLAAIAQSIPDLLIVAIILLIAHWVVDALGYLFDGVKENRIHLGWLDADTVGPTRRLVTIGVWLFAVVMAYPYIPGSGSEAFKGLSVLIGLMISVGASGIVGQAASGLILMYTHTLRPGDFARVGDSEGTVLEVGLFTTRMRTGLGEELALPNGMVLTSVMRNYSRTSNGEGFVVDAVATIGYDTPWRQVHAMLTEAALRTEGVLADPPPAVFQTALSDFYVEYRLVCHALPSEPRPRAIVQSVLHQNIQDVFNEHGVQIMSPHYLGDPAAAKVVPPAQWYPPPATPPR